MKTNKILSKTNLLIFFIIAISCALTVWLILFGLKADIIKNSTSEIGGKYGHYTEMVLLGVAFFLFYAGGGVLSIILWGYKDKIAPIIYFIGCLCYLATCVIPFLPDLYPVWSDAHDVLARVAVGILLLSVTWFVIVLYKGNLALAIIASIGLVASVASASTLIGIYGTCIIGETIIQLYLCWLIAVTLIFAIVKKSKQTT